MLLLRAGPTGLLPSSRWEMGWGAMEGIICTVVLFFCSSLTRDCLNVPCRLAPPWCAVQGGVA